MVRRSMGPMSDQPVTVAILNEALGRFGKQIEVRFDGIDTRLDGIPYPA